MKLHYGDAAYGIPMLINSARAIASRGGKMVLLNPQRTVAEVLEITGILQIIPVHSDPEAAKAELLAV